MLVTLVDDSIPFNGMTPAYQPIGGAEKAFASLPAALARSGHVVRAVNRSPNSLGFENVSWIHWDGRKPPITEVLIAFRKPALLEFTRATKARILWVTGPPDYLHRPAVNEVLTRTDAKLVFLGNTHSEAYRTEGQNAIYYRSIAPGVREEYRSGEEIAPEDPPTAVVTTHPKHDLDWLLGLWVERIRPQAPNAHLQVYSAAFKRAETGETLSDELMPIFEKARAAADHGVTIMAPTGDRDMAKAYAMARVHLYPRLRARDVLLDTGGIAGRRPAGGGAAGGRGQGALHRSSVGISGARRRCLRRECAGHAEGRRGLREGEQDGAPERPEQELGYGGERVRDALPLKRLCAAPTSRRISPRPRWSRGRPRSPWR